MAKKKAWVSINKCVACGACISSCPLEAIRVEKGMFAKVNQNKCVGCTKCTKVCPASIIDIVEKESVI